MLRKNKCVKVERRLLILITILSKKLAVIQMHSASHSVPNFLLCVIVTVLTANSIKEMGTATQDMVELI